MLANKIVIIDYGMGNLNSIWKSLNTIKVNSIISSNPRDIINSHKIVLPGIGHFGQVMIKLKELNLAYVLHECVLIKQKPILGICLGMQIMTQKSEEGRTEGLGWFDAKVIKFSVSDKLKYKVPHIGWNSISIKKKSLLMKDISDEAQFYFLHSYHLEFINQSNLLNETYYDYVFPSAIEKNNIFGVQYHPEKSHDDGKKLLENFIKL